MDFGRRKKQTTKESEWYYPSGKNLEKTSASNAYVETFNDSKIESLAREICQNSLDAAISTEEPVKVTFEMLDIKTSLIPGYAEIVKEIIPNAEKAWPDEQKTKLLISKMRNLLTKDKVSILKISDENTTGLAPQKWASLIEQAGSSVKSNDESGGSFGIGKAAPFAVSDLRMVFYNTLAGSEGQQSIGVSKFVSYDLANGETTQGTGYYGKFEKTPFDNGVKFDINQRQTKGTDIYIMGFDTQSFPDWESEIIYSILDNFLLSINKNKLVVNVAGKKVNSATIADYLDEIKANKKLEKQYDNLVSYYDVLSDEQHIKFNMPAFPELGIEDDEAVLLLSNKGRNNRKVLMTRSAGMKIFDKKRISGILKFSGVFQATGTHINSILKSLENPNHDKWSVDRAVDKKQAKAFLKHVSDFIKQKITEQYQEKITEEVDAFGVSDFLPSDLAAVKNNETYKEQQKQTKPNVVLKEIHKDITDTVPIRANEPGEIDDTEVINQGITEGDLSGKGFDSSNGSGGGLGFGDNTFGIGDEPGSNGIDPSGENVTTFPSVPKKKISDLAYRVIEVDANSGHYRIALKPTQSIKEVVLNVAIVGDSGNKSKVKVVSASNHESLPLKTTRNAIYLDTLLSNKWQSIEMQLSQTGRLKLEVEVYANIK